MLPTRLSCSRCPRESLVGKAGNHGTRGLREPLEKLLALGLSSLFFSLSNISSGLHNPFEFLFHMHKQAFQSWDSNQKGQESNWRNLFSSYKQDTQCSFSLFRPNKGNSFSMNQNELGILTSRIVRQRKSHPGLHGKRLVLVPHFQTQKLFPVSVCFNKRRVKGKSLCLQHSD